MAPPVNPRLRTIADAAITVLAERGLRGLTHRAVDEAAALPPGSTSYYLRTRAALLDATVARLAELDLAPEEGMSEEGMSGEGFLRDPVRLADFLAEMLHSTLTRHGVRALARYELSLEAARRPELRATLDAAGRAFRDLAAALLAGLGSPDPERQGRMLVAYCDGILFDSLVGAGQATRPTLDELRVSFGEIVTGFLTADTRRGSSLVLGP
jgi:AcrR family transcriptional regulator